MLINTQKEKILNQKLNGQSNISKHKVRAINAAVSFVFRQLFNYRQIWNPLLPHHLVGFFYLLII